MSKIYELPGEIYENFETGKIKGFRRTLIIMLSPLLVIVGASICIAIVGYDFVKGNK